MNLYPLTTLWLQILTMIAVEVGIVALFLAVAQRWSRTAVWRRTFCQVALISSLVIAGSEFSGAGRSLISRFFGQKEWRGPGASENSTLNGQVTATPEDRLT